MNLPKMFKIMLKPETTIENCMSKRATLNFQISIHVWCVTVSVCLAPNLKVNLFYYSDYFYYYLQILLYFLLLFMDSTVLFQLIFTFIYSTFNKKKFVSTK